MSFPRYERYKESGVEWLGEVPEWWSIAPLKWEIERIDGGVWGDEPDGKDDTIVFRSTEQTVDGLWKIEDPAYRKLTISEKKASILSVGDLLVTKSSGSSLHIGKTSLVTEEVAGMGGCYSNFMQRLRLKPSFIPKFAWYIMNNDLARIQFDYLSNSTTGLANLNATMIGQIILAVPSIPEQHIITAFLDRETGKIDALVAEQERLIALLKEKRQAVISHAVTKGLDPDAPMKDSGIEWLGEVPKHWEANKIKNLFCKTKRLDHPTLTVLSVYREYGVIRKDSRDDNMNKTPDDLSVYQLVEVNDLVVNKMKAWQGSLGVSLYQGIISPDYVVFSPKHVESSLYVHSLLRLKELSSVYRTISNGIRPNQWRLEPENFEQLFFYFPPLNEQVQIAAFIEVETHKFDSLIVEAEQAVGLLKERRSAMISAAVTGKIDVRGAA